MRTRTLVGVIFLMVVAAACGESVTITNQPHATSTIGTATTTIESTTLASPEQVVSTTSTTTAKPPTLVVVDPEPNAIVATRDFVFRGTTDPGCTVEAAGSYSAAVDASGNWTVTLMLNAGSNVATLEATGPSGLVTEAQVDVSYHPPIVLRSDGLGVVDFGTPMNATLAALTDLFGTDPDRVGDEAEWVEFIGWSDLGLYVGSSTPRSEEYDGVQRFIGWTYFSTDADPLFSTGRGMSVGTTVAELREIFGDELDLPEADPDVCGGWFFRVGDPTEPDGWLDGPPVDAAAVGALHAGMSTGC